MKFVLSTHDTSIVTRQGGQSGEERNCVVRGKRTRERCARRPARLPRVPARHSRAAGCPPSEMGPGLGVMKAGAPATGTGGSGAGSHCGAGRALGRRAASGGDRSSTRMLQPPWLSHRLPACPATASEILTTPHSRHIRPVPLPGARRSMVAGMEPNAENKLFVGGCPHSSSEDDLRAVRRATPPPRAARHLAPRHTTSCDAPANACPRRTPAFIRARSSSRSTATSRRSS